LTEEPVVQRLTLLVSKGMRAIRSLAGEVVFSAVFATRGVSLVAPAALAARQKGQHNVIARDDLSNPAAHRLHYAGSLVAQDNRMRHGKKLVSRHHVRVTHARSHHPYQDFVVTQVSARNLLDLEWPTLLPNHGGGK
jgi:hypothetical protein